MPYIYLFCLLFFPLIALAQSKDCPDCPEIVHISSGDFLMGDSSGNGRENETPVQIVHIENDYGIGKYPVTFSQFEAFVKDTHYETESEKNPKEGCWGLKEDLTPGWRAGTSWRNTGFPQKASSPVVCVSWHDAVEYTEWISQKTGKTYRLPTETEWEFAARGGKKSKYYYGNDEKLVCEHINHGDAQMIKAWEATDVSTCDDGYLTTSPVGSYRANSFGLYDIAGNVWEWAADCYYDDLEGVNESEGARSKLLCRSRTLRGGSWASKPQGITVSYRIDDSENMRTVDYGFRVVRE